MKPVNDPLLPRFAEKIAGAPEHYKPVRGNEVALLSIDLQYLGAMPGDGIFSDIEKYGIPPESQEYYFYQLHKVVLPNVQKLFRFFRKQKLEIIHTRIQSLTQDGRDRSPGHKRLGLHAAPGSKEAEFLPRATPFGDEIVLNKTASGVFAATNLDYILRNIGVTRLYMAGVFTNECVSNAVRQACDLGYHVTLLRDACAAVTPELQRNTVNALKDRYARVLTIEEAITELREQSDH